MRSGKVIFNEVHQYENYDNIKVFTTGQGKVAQPRRGYFTSNGDISDGPLDDYLARGRRILFEGEADNGLSALHLLSEPEGAGASTGKLADGKSVPAISSGALCRGGG